MFRAPVELRLLSRVELSRVGQWGKALTMARLWRSACERKTDARESHNSSSYRIVLLRWLSYNLLTMPRPIYVASRHDTHRRFTSCPAFSSFAIHRNKWICSVSLLIHPLCVYFTPWTIKTCHLSLVTTSAFLVRFFYTFVLMETGWNMNTLQ